jgi:hypothetical protein
MGKGNKALLQARKAEEKIYKPWIESDLFAGGIKKRTTSSDGTATSCDPLQRSNAEQFLEDLIENRNEGKMLFRNLQKLTGFSLRTTSQMTIGGPAGT